MYLRDKAGCYLCVDGVGGLLSLETAATARRGAPCVPHRLFVCVLARRRAAGATSLLAAAAARPRGGKRAAMQDRHVLATRSPRAALFAHFAALSS